MYVDWLYIELLNLKRFTDKFIILFHINLILN